MLTFDIVVGSLTLLPSPFLLGLLLLLALLLLVLLLLALLQLLLLLLLLLLQLLLLLLLLLLKLLLLLLLLLLQLLLLLLLLLAQLALLRRLPLVTARTRHTGFLWRGRMRPRPPGYRGGTSIASTSFTPEARRPQRVDPTRGLRACSPSRYLRPASRTVSSGVGVKIP